MPHVLRCTPDAAEAITRFGAHGASSVHLGSGVGESHAYVLHFGPDGEIGAHEAGFDQVFLVISGSAWLSVDGDTVDLASGEAGFVPRGSTHAKGSRSGGTALMFQALDMIRD
jgi:quercetin dioxygenase-like cupin family protein